MEETMEKMEAVETEGVKRNKDHAVRQYTVSESLSAAQMRNYSYFLLVFFFSLYVPLYKTEYMSMSGTESVNISSDKQKQFTIEIKSQNFSKTNVFALLQYQMLPTSSVTKKKVKWNVKLSADHFDSSGKLVKQMQNRIWHEFQKNESFHPFHYAPTDYCSQISVTLMGICDKEWIEVVNLRWVIGEGAAFDVAYITHALFCCIYIPLLLFYFASNINKNISMRTKYVGVLLAFGFLSQVPYELLGFSFHKSDAFRDFFAAISFSFSYLFWCIKAHEFNLKVATGTKNVKLMITGTLMGVYSIYRVFMQHLQLFSIPSLPDGADPDAGEFLKKNIYPLIIAFTFYQLAIEIIDKTEKKQGEDLDHYVADHFPFFFASLFSVYTAFKQLKRPFLVVNPVIKAFSYGVWDLVLFFEAFMSTSSLQSSCHKSIASDGQLDFEVDEMRLEQIQKQKMIGDEAISKITEEVEEGTEKMLPDLPNKESLHPIETKENTEQTEISTDQNATSGEVNPVISCKNCGTESKETNHMENAS